MSTQRAHQLGSLPVWTFADKIRKARTIAGLTQDQFALRLELTPSTVAAYETGRSTPRFNDAQKLAKKLGVLTGVPYSWFLHDDDPNEPENSPSVTVLSIAPVTDLRSKRDARPSFGGRNDPTDTAPLAAI